MANRKIKKYAIFWNATANEGHFILQLVESEGRSPTALIHLDSPQEATLLLDIFRNEQPVYYDDDHGLVLTGLEEIGEGEA